MRIFDGSLKYSNQNMSFKKRNLFFLNSIKIQKITGQVHYSKTIEFLYQLKYYYFFI